MIARVEEKEGGKGRGVGGEMDGRGGISRMKEGGRGKGGRIRGVKRG